MSSHFTDPWYWIYALMGLTFWLIWVITELLAPSGIKARLRQGFAQWRFWPAFMGLSAGGASTAALDAEPTVAVGLGALAYFLTGFNPKAGKDEPWLAKNSD